MSDSPAKIRFELFKSPLFRVVHVDGAFGGLTPRGELFVSIYNERHPIPTAIIHSVKASGEIGEEIRSEREGRKATVREVEIGLQFELEVAKNFVDWFQKKINEAEKTIAEAKQ